MILANLYNKVMGFFRQAETEEVESAKDTACNRLRVVLMQDRTNLTPELMDRMRRELVELLSKYVEMDKEALDLSLEQDGDQVALMLSIPVIRAKDEDEIKATLEAEDAEKDGAEDCESTEEEIIAEEDSESEDDEEDKESEAEEIMDEVEIEVSLDEDNEALDEEDEK